MQSTLNVFKMKDPAQKSNIPTKTKRKSIDTLWPVLCVQKDIQTLKMELFMLFLYIFAEAESRTERF